MGVSYKSMGQGGEGRGRRERKKGRKEKERGRERGEGRGRKEGKEERVPVRKLSSSSYQDPQISLTHTRIHDPSLTLQPALLPLALALVSLLLRS